MIRVTEATLTRILGEPDDIRMIPAGGTLMKYQLHWHCGCRAEKAGGHVTAQPCRSHYDEVATSV